jgi:hypothetical protein
VGSPAFNPQLPLPQNQETSNQTKSKEAVNIPSKRVKSLRWKSSNTIHMELRMRKS